MIRFTIKLAQDTQGTRIEGTKINSAHAHELPVTLKSGRYPATLDNGSFVVHARNFNARFFNEEQNIFIDGWKGKVVNGIIGEVKRERGTRPIRRSGTSRTGRFRSGIIGTSAYHVAARQAMMEAYSDAIWDGRKPARHRRAIAIILPCEGRDKASEFRYWTGADWSAAGALGNARLFDSFRDARKYIRVSFRGIDVSSLCLDDTEGRARVRPWRRRDK